MNTNRLDNYFSEWVQDKELTDCITNVYGQSGLMAIVNFINFVKDKENDNVNKKGCGRIKKYNVQRKHAV